MSLSQEIAHHIRTSNEGHRKPSLSDKDIITKNINFKREIVYTAIGLLITVVAAFFLTFEIFQVISEGLFEHDFKKVGQQSLFFGIVFFLVYGNLLYQLTRMGYMRRLLKHKPANHQALNKLYVGKSPSLTVLVPSYKEEAKVIKQTLLSSCLQEYPLKRVTLLIDDPHEPKAQEDIDGLISARRLPFEIKSLLNGPLEMCQKAIDSFEARVYMQTFNAFDESLYLCGVLDKVSMWFQIQADRYAVIDHTDEFFFNKVFSRTLSGIS